MARHSKHRFLLFFVVLTLSVVMGCGGGGGAGSTPAQPSPTPTPAAGSFSMNVSASSFTAAPGSHVGPLIVNPATSPGFLPKTTLMVKVPTGVSCVPACQATSPEPAVTLFDFIISSAVPLGNYTITVTATGGGQTQSVDIALAVQPAPPVVPNRSSFVRTDDTPSDIVFDPIRHLIYTANRLLNRIEVISEATSAIVQTISVPKPVGMDITLDNNSLYVGVEAQQLYRIDLTRMQVAERIQYKATQSFQPPFPDQPVTLASGRVLVRTSCGELVCTTESDLVEYNPATHTFRPLSPANVSLSVGLMARSADHTKALVADGVSGRMDLFDSASDTFVAQDDGSLPGAAFSISSNANGTQFAMVKACCELLIVDANLHQVFTHTDNGTFLTGGLHFSSDGTRLFVSESTTSGHPVIHVFDGSTFADLGHIPDLKLSTSRPTLRTVTDDGMLLGSVDNGLAMVDSTVPPVQVPAVGTSLFQAGLQPSHPVAGDRHTVMSGAGFQFTPEVSFGAQPATSVSYVSTQEIDMVAPPPLFSGAVNVKSLFPGGFFSIAPDGYSYGPQPLFAGVSMGPVSGGDSTTIMGYGLNYDPAQVSVTVAGQPATGITMPPSSGGIFPVQKMEFVTPPASGPADTTLTINTPDGSATTPYHYVSETSLPLLNVGQMVFDDARNRLFATDSVNNLINVISLPNGTRSQIPVGIDPVGIALTPDGTRLLTANLSSNTVTIVDPDNPVNLTNLTVASGDTQPVSIAALAGGKAFVGMDSFKSIGCVGVVLELDLTTFAITNRTQPFPPCTSNQFLVTASGDGTRAFVGSLLWEQAGDVFTPLPQEIVPDGSHRAASLTGNVFASERALFDSKMRWSYVADWPALLQCFCGATGVKLHSSGSLLYVALSETTPGAPDKLDIFDVRRGTLLRRIDAPGKWAPALDVLAVDKSGTRIFGATQTGVVEFQIASAPLSLGNITPASGTIGTLLKVTGSGFVAGTSVTVGSQPATTTFVDANTLNVVAPNLPPGAYDVRINNPSGETYSADAVFTMN